MKNSMEGYWFGSIAHSFSSVWFETIMGRARKFLMDAVNPTVCLAARSPIAVVRSACAVRNPRFTHGSARKLSKLRRAGYLVTLPLAVALMPSGASAACDPQFRQVNVDGFGDRFNVYAWSMKEFNGLLYVGTGHISTVQPDIEGSAELWRYDGTNWEQVTDTGFDAPNNTGFRNLQILRGNLYAGTINETDGAEIWRSGDGVIWEPVMQGGFGNLDNEAVRGMTTFRRRMYAGTHNTAGGPGELWRSLSGSSWNAIAPEGFGFPNNSSVHTLEKFNGSLYAGVRNTKRGAQIWRSSDGIQFEAVVGPRAATPSGFGNRNTIGIFDMQEFNGMLYVATFNVVDGFGFYRTADGVDYEQIGDFGFGDPENDRAWRLHTFEGALWLGVGNRNVLRKGASLWRSFDGVTWEEMVGANGTFMGYGFDDTRNWGVRTFETFNGKLYIGTAQCEFGNCAKMVTGAEVWEWPGEACLNPQ